MSHYETVIYEMYDQVALITLNRPQRRNAMDQALNRDLLAAILQAANDTSVRAVVLTGAGQGFCAGADLTLFQPVPTPEQVYDMILTYYQPMMLALLEMRKPTIAAVNGAAAGAGASLALACDLRVLAHDANILMAFSNIGLVPDAGATWFLARQVGYGRAYEITAEGRRIPAERCLELGLANKVVPADALREQALEWAQRLAQRPTLALGFTKHALQHALLNDLASTIEFEARLQQQTIVSHDFMEGVLAFMQKRPPEFKGE
jgi:2-(1,2-epoxy-1,2-dihydrophenyl)acetyl-CoA isomerase